MLSSADPSKVTTSAIARDRAFAWDDQLAFARLSGDFNPLHVEPVIARRTPFGAPVVHGMHGVLWLLDALSEPATSDLDLGKLRVVFAQPIRVGDRAAIVWDGSMPARATIEVEGRTVLRLEVHVAVDEPGFRRATPSLPAAAPAGTCADLTFDEASAVSGALPLALDRHELVRLFPSLGRRFPPVQVAELLAITRLVGMVCPGRQSTLAELDLRRRSDSPGALELTHRVARAEGRYAAIHLAIEGPTLTGQVKTFFRPLPQEQPGAARLKRVVDAGEFGSQHALVIGGSRGLGEVTAKLLAIGGAQVVITYRSGEDDARRVVADIVAAGGTCEAIELDCEAAASLDRLPAGGFAPTHLYYFATPAIVPGAPRTFSHAAFARYCRIYVEGLFATVHAVRATSTGPLTVFYPSTVYLDEPAPNLAEYCAAKAAGEALCRQLAAQPGLTCYAPRLPRMRTDQTLGFVGRPAPEPQDILLSELRAMARAQRKPSARRRASAGESA